MAELSVGYATSNEISAAQIEGMDLETAVMTVQIRRTQHLETSLKDQLQTISNRNGALAEMQDTLTGKRTYLASIPKQVEANKSKIAEMKQLSSQLNEVEKRDPNGYTGLSYGWAKDSGEESYKMPERLQAAGVTVDPSTLKNVDGNGTLDAHASAVRNWIAQLDTSIDELGKENTNLTQKEKEISVQIENLKSGMDSLSSTLQMEMLHVQSLNNKRNEAFDVMTNLTSKFNQSRSTISGNLR